ncbi:MAG: class II fructose-bisphosphate aldolase, partial [Planctomycetota bacterium]
ASRTAGPISAALWQRAVPAAGAPLPEASPDQTAAHLAAATALRQDLGHYLGAMLFYGGQWYWGIDRLHHLERRLQDLGAQRRGVSGLMFTPDADLQKAMGLGIAKVNVATALIAAYRESLLSQWNAKQNLWTPIAQGEAAKAMAPVVEEWILRLNADGKA